MNNEFKFYTSYLFFLNMFNEGVLNKKEFQKITKKLICKYNVYITPFILNIA